MSKQYFQAGQFSVTSAMVRARTRSIQTATIESVDLGRPFFWIALASGIGLAGLAIPFGDLLYPHELMTFTRIGVGAMIITWPMGSLRVFSKLTGERGWSVLGRMKTLHAMRDAIETALGDQDRKPSRRASLIKDEDDDA